MAHLIRWHGAGVVTGKVCVAVVLAVIVTARGMTWAADAPHSHIIVPSRSTAVELESLSQKSNVLADVLTIDRKEYVLQLDGSGDHALSGHILIREAAGKGETETPIIRLPFEQLALVYYFEIPPAANQRPDHLVKDKYPSLPAVGSAERKLNCNELDLETARAGTIRWYARQHPGVVPFTEHEANARYGRNALKYTGEGLLVIVALMGATGFGGGGGGGGGCWTCSALPAPVDLEALRWAVTAADRRELELLQLKRDRPCPAHAIPDGEFTDLDILSKIEATRRDLDAHQLSDRDQMKQQTEFLDRLDPTTDFRLPIEERTAREQAEPVQAQFDALVAQLGPFISRAANVQWWEGSCEMKEIKKNGDWHWEASDLVILQHALLFQGKPVHWGVPPFWQSLPLREVDSVLPRVHLTPFTPWVPWKKRDGSCFYFQASGHQRMTEQLGRMIDAELSHR